MLPLLYSMLALISFDDLSVAYAYLLSLHVKVILLVMLCITPELRTSDDQ